MRFHRWLIAGWMVMILGGVAFGGTPKQKPLEVCLVSGSLEYKSDESLAKLQKYLEKNYQIRCTRAFRKSVNDLPGLENLAKCDVAIFFTRRMTLPADQLKLVKQYCESGKPIVGIRTASHGFQNWLAFDKEVLGGNYKNHYANNLTCQVTLTEAGKKHPITKEIKPFTSVASLYRNTGTAEDAKILLTGSIPKHSEPLAWTRMHKGGRVFYTSLGHPEDFDNEQFLELLVNAIHWTRERAPAKPR